MSWTEAYIPQIKKKKDRWNNRTFGKVYDQTHHRKCNLDLKLSKEGQSPSYKEKYIIKHTLRSPFLPCKISRRVSATTPWPPDGGKQVLPHCWWSVTGTTSMEQNLALSKLNSHILLRILPTHILADWSNNLHTNLFAEALF